MSIGEEGYCSKEITDVFIFYKTEQGFFIPKSMVDNGIIDIQFSDDVEEETIRSLDGSEKTIQERRQKEKEKQLSDL